MTDEATQRQIDAARPGASTWLSANAGSGKTRVLTDRVARLLLDGAAPQNILCLTYTKAAASEMQNRLFRRLGDWAMTPADTLRDRLRELGVEGPLDDSRLQLARTLFARAIETPGGLKIQTIHSFCAGLLRRFPLEAGVSPQFTEMDDRAAKLLTGEIIEEMADTLAPDVIDTVARHYSAEDFSALTDEIARHRDRFFPPLDAAAIRERFGLPPGLDAQTLVDEVLCDGTHDLLARVGAVMAKGSVTDAKVAEVLLTVAKMPAGPDALGLLEKVLLFGAAAKTPFGAKVGTVPTKGTQAKLPEDLDDLNDLMQRVEAARDTRLSLLAAEKSAALHLFAQTFLPLYEARKLARGWLDFDDLILKARALMTDPAVAAWVLYRLDGGIDHVLVDEAQDTSPTQWRVIELLTQEFTAGQGARDPGDRSLFVVGDLKQSIYSFQGAQPEAFQRMFDHFSARLAEAAPLQRLELQHSFRSSAAILRMVDAVFQGNGDAPTDLGAIHRAFHTDMPGRVDLWPIAEDAEEEEPAEWFDPVDRVSPGAADVRLAEMVAGEIHRMLEQGETIPGQDGTRRPVRAGDFLILVQRRKRLFTELIRACKARGLNIAGADRLKLGAEMAVRDLRALLAFLATPEDDLSLACALRSPLFGLSEAQLYTLAQGRDGYLWHRLRNARDDHPETLAVLHDLRANADFLRPYDLLERVLLRHRGRPNLLARLGGEAQDGLDELLNQALAYERMDIPSLTGFLAWLDADDVEVKRQADSAGDRIRVMTVHGAKGLESPVVILPDTLRRKADIRAQTFPAEDGTPLWRTVADDMPDLLQSAKAELVAADDAERARLLYVAMTRAETWLIVCGAGKPVVPSWYDTVATAMGDLAAVEFRCPAGTGLRFSHGDWNAGPRLAPPVTDAAETALPGWISTPAPQPESDEPLSPSDLGGAKALPGPGEDTETAKARGTALHLLLEHLPELSDSEWSSAASVLLGDEQATALLPVARAVLAAPDMAPLFAPGTLAEVEFTASLDGRALHGTIDRLLIRPDSILIVDFKTNLVLPDTPAGVPEGILRQLGAYRAAMGEIYPNHRIETAILWTAVPCLMTVPADMVRNALAKATIS